MDIWIRVFPIAGLIGLVVALGIYLSVKRLAAGSEVMQNIAEQIQIGAMTFLKRQYLTLLFFVCIVALLLAFFLKWQTAIAFIFGAVCSVLAGFLGMKAATKANVRTAQAAKEGGQGPALLAAFNGFGIVALSSMIFRSFQISLRVNLPNINCLAQAAIKYFLQTLPTGSPLLWYALLISA